MTIRAQRSRLFWSPLIGWALLSCSVSSVHAQATTTEPTATTTPSDADAGGRPTMPSSVPAGGAVAPIILPTNPTQPYGAPKPGDPGYSSYQQQINQTAQPVVPPSAGTTIVDAPFGSSVPYYGGITSPIAATRTAGGGSAPGDAVGITLGAFTLIPQLELNVGVDNNVFAQSASLGTSGSLYSTVTPSLDLKSDWNNHMLHAVASGTLGWYASAPTQDFQNYGLLVDGRVDIRHDVYVTGAIGFKRATEALGTPNVAFAQAPTVVDTLPVEIGLYQEFNDVFYQVGARATRFWHYDNSLITSSGLPASSRDRFEYAETARLGYHVGETLDLYLAPSLNQVSYVNKVNAVGQERDSTGSILGVGATWRPNEFSVLEGEVGYQNKVYETGFGSDSGLAYSLKGTWSGYAPLTLRPTITRSINETALSNYKNYTSTIFALDYTYVIHDAWTLAGGLLFSIADYAPADGTGVNPRTDYFMRGQIGLLYSIKPEVQIGPFFEYSHGSSTDPTGPSYDRQIYSIRLIAKR
ncbi:MAG: outer membrane beta-barrel protein [Proteobacteria bacterium]|nr:outer membrane beta-barrel protein [Pseudomonadota bacterium]